MNVIETRALTKTYGRARGITDVTLTVKEGDFFGFIGPNGAGKSTTIRTLLGLISPTSGAATVLGYDVVKECTKILQNVGYLPSEMSFYGGMTVGEVLAFSAKLRKTDCAAERARLCERLELDTTRKVSQLSLGNRKKVGIVCALQCELPLYILDEPTSGLDPLMQREFFTILEERNRRGTAVFLSSHVLSEVGKHCKTAAVIGDGRLLVCDAVEDLVHTNVKHVTLRGVSDWVTLSGADAETVENGTVNFLYGGDPKTLICELSTRHFEDVTVTDPDFEEIFLHYYAKGEE